MRSGDGRSRPTLAERLALELEWLPGWVGRGPCAREAAAMYARPDHAVTVCGGCRFLPAPLDPGGIVAGLTPAERGRARKEKTP